MRLPRRVGYLSAPVGHHQIRVAALPFPLGRHRRHREDVQGQAGGLRPSMALPPSPCVGVIIDRQQIAAPRPSVFWGVGRKFISAAVSKNVQVITTDQIGAYPPSHPVALALAHPFTSAHSSLCIPSPRAQSAGTTEQIREVFVLLPKSYQCILSSPDSLDAVEPMALDPVPVNVVHARLLFGAVRKNDPLLILRNFIKMLSTSSDSRLLLSACRILVSPY